MNGKDLLDKMSDVDPKLITDAENSNKKPKNKRAMFIGISSGMATVAAAAVLAVVIGRNPAVTPPVIEDSNTNSGVVSDTNSTVISNPGTNSGDNPVTSAPTTPVIKDPPAIDFSGYEHLPVITDKNYGTSGWGNGVSKNRPTTRAELEIHSPWRSDPELKTMPVYKSTSTEADNNEMREYIKKAAAALGIPESKLEFRDTAGNIESQLESIRKSAEASGAPEEEIERELDRLRRSMLSNSSVEAKADGVIIYLYTDYSMKVSFDTPIKLPEGCKLGRDAADGEKLAAAEYLAEKFKELLGYEKPVITKDPEDPKYYRVYEDAGNIEDRILNFSTKYVNFYGNSEDTNAMKFMWINSNENCVKLDDYPIYTAEQAVEILKSNKYSDDERMPSDAKILKTDLVYHNAVGYTVVLPYYEIYVETDGTPTDGKDVVCDIYKICAVPDQFVDVQNVDYGAHA